MPLILASQNSGVRGRQMSESFEASLIYRVSSKTISGLHRETQTKTKTKATKPNKKTTNQIMFPPSPYSTRNYQKKKKIQWSSKVSLSSSILGCTMTETEVWE